MRRQTLALGPLTSIDVASVFVFLRPSTVPTVKMRRNSCAPQIYCEESRPSTRPSRNSEHMSQTGHLERILHEATASSAIAGREHATL